MRLVGSTEVPAFSMRMWARPDRGAWSVLVTPDDVVAVVANDIAEELRSMEGIPVVVEAVDSAEHLMKILRGDKRACVVAIGFDEWGDAQWQEMDATRSRLERAGEVAMVMGPMAAEQMANNAPHFMSWVGGAIWRIDVEAERRNRDAGRERRLCELREWSGLTDVDVIQRAEEGTLPSEPEYAEWLVLLDHGDLVKSR